MNKPTETKYNIRNIPNIKLKENMRHTEFF